MTALVVVGILIVFVAMGLWTLRSVQSERETDRQRLSKWQSPGHPDPES